MPSQRSGKNPNWESEELTYYDFDTLGTYFQAYEHLVGVDGADEAACVARELVDVWRWEHFMPDASSENYSGRV
jgi:hypothetical protein